MYVAGSKKIDIMKRISHKLPREPQTEKIAANEDEEYYIVGDGRTIFSPSSLTLRHSRSKISEFASVNVYQAATQTHNIPP